ncbi:hypothetical protein ACUR5C_11345 [Aliikangiella sp. IMCC44653]
MTVSKWLKLVLLAVVIVVSGLNSLPAQANMQLAIDLNASLKQLTEAAAKVQQQNGPEVITKFGKILGEQNSDESLKAAGRAIKYSSAVKQEFDVASNNVITNIDRIIAASEIASDQSECKRQLDKILPQYTKLKAAVEESARLSVSNDEARAKAFVAANHVIGLTLIGAQFSMLSVGVCR